MLSCPKKFSQKVLEEDYCNEICSLFNRTQCFLDNNPDFLADSYKEYKKNACKGEIQKQDFVWGYLIRILNEEEEAGLISILRNFLIEKLES